MTASLIANIYLLENVKNQCVREEALWDTMDRINTISALYVLNNFPDFIWDPEKEKRKMKTKRKIKFLDKVSNRSKFLMLALVLDGIGFGLSAFDDRRQVKPTTSVEVVDVVSDISEEVAEAASEIMDSVEFSELDE